jgi:hypothetical protein
VPAAACPFCFRRIDSSRLAYQCSGRGDTECEKTADAARTRLTGSTMATYPTFMPPEGRGDQAVRCPVCGDPASRRACPECHTALPIGFTEFGSTMIGLVGAKGSGKSVLMTVLIRQLRDTTGKRYSADVRLDTDNPDRLRGLSDYQADREAPLFTDGILPPSKSAAPVLLRWRQTVTRRGRTSVKCTMVPFVDTAGEDLDGTPTAFTVQYLSACGGLIITLDPFALPGARAALNLPDLPDNACEDMPLHVVAGLTDVLRAEYNLRKDDKIPIPVAVVLTKIDAFLRKLDPGNPLMTAAPAEPARADADGQAVHEHVLALLHQWNAHSIDTHMRLNYREFRYFGVSALGAEPDYEKSTVTPGRVRPRRVEDPVLWLLPKTGIALGPMPPATP